MDRIKILTGLTLLGLGFFVAHQVYYAWTLIDTPYQAEYREGAILVMTDAISHYKNPFTLENHPLLNTNYGFLYNLAVLPIAMAFGNSLFVHRMISFVLIFFSSLLIGLTLLRTKTSFLFAIAGGVLLMGGLLFGMTPLARPDSLGVLLFLASLIHPWRQDFNFASLSMSIGLALLAFLTKPYFLLSIGMIAVYLFLFRSKKQGLVFGLLSLICLMILVMIINYLFELYWLDIFLNNLSNAALSDSALKSQTTWFLEIYLPCFALILIRYLSNAGNGKVNLTGISAPVEVDFRFLDKPLFKVNADYFVFLLMCTGSVVVLVLGRHSGAYMIYFFQLISPLLILITLSGLHFHDRLSALFIGLILINLFVINFRVLPPNRLSEADRRAWEELYTYLTNSKNILNSPVLVSEMIRLGMEPVDTGQTEYFFRTRPYSPTIFAPEYDTIFEHGENYQKSIRIAVTNQRFDRIMITHNKALNFANRRLIDQYYTLQKIIPASMPQTEQLWTVEVWEPKAQLP